MAGGKQTARQKMINLMYLVFIAMMALQMPREALTAFAMMSDKFVEANKNAEAQNENLLGQLSIKAEEESVRYAEPYQRAQQISALSNEFNAYLETLKTSVVEPFEKDRNEAGNLPYEQMDKSDIVNYEWFTKDNYSEKGEEIVAKINQFRESFKELLGPDATYNFLREDLDKKFSTDDVEGADGITRPYLEHHYKGYPAVSTMAKLSSMQNDVRQVEQDAYNLFLGNSLKEAASMRNYQAMVFTDKSVYFEGETITGRVVLGRYDKATVPTEVVVNGNKVNLSNANSFADGQVKINTRAGGLGEHKFSGHFTFLEEGEPIKVDIQNSNYVVVPRPNSATIAADRMNVVYIGVDNPISASFAGIPSDKVSVTASRGDLTKVADGKYILRPTVGQGNIVITASGTLPDGSTVTDTQEFRPKVIPRPTGTIRNANLAEGPAENLKISTVGAMFEDFEFDVEVTVTEFTILFPRGQGSITVKGSNRLTPEAQRKVDQLKPGDNVIFSGIKTSLKGVNIPSRDATNATFTIQ